MDTRVEPAYDECLVWRIPRSITLIVIPAKAGYPVPLGFTLYRKSLGVLDHPPSRVMTVMRAVAASRRLRVPDRPPDALRGQRHVDMRDAVFGECIEDRIDDSREAAGAARFSAAFGAQRIGFGRHRMIADRHDRNVFGARQRIVHERAGDRLAV